MFFSSSNITCFTFYVTCLLTLPRTLRRHLHALRVSDNAAWRKCGQEEEFCQCPVLAGHRRMAGALEYVKDHNQTGSSPGIEDRAVLKHPSEYRSAQWGPVVDWVLRATRSRLTFRPPQIRPLDRMWSELLTAVKGKTIPVTGRGGP
jgi:hypothetical protein